MNSKHRNLPDNVWNKMKSELKPAEGVEALRPFLRLLAKRVLKEEIEKRILKNNSQEKS